MDTIQSSKRGTKERLKALQELEQLKEQEKALLSGKGKGSSPLIPPKYTEAVEEARAKGDNVRLVLALEAEEKAIEKALSTAKKGSQRRIDLLRALQQVKEELAAAERAVAQHAADRLDLQLARAERTPGLRDDLVALEAQDRFINQQLRKRNLSLAERAELLRQQSAIRARIKQIRDKLPLTAKELATADLKPGDLKDIPGIPALLKTVAQLEAGRSTRQDRTEIPGIGVILTPAKPNLDDWKKVLILLEKKLQAAQFKLIKLQNSLTVALSKPAKIRATSAWKTAVQRLRATIAQLKKDIVELKAAIADAQVVIKELYDAINDQKMQDAQEIEDRHGVDETTFLHAVAAGQPIPGGDHGGGDSGGGDSGGGGGDSGGGGSSGSDTGKLTQAEQNAAIDKEVVAYLSGLRSLRALMSNVYSPFSALRGNTITVHNYFADKPKDPHHFTKGLEFELKAFL